MYRKWSPKTRDCEHPYQEIIDGLTVLSCHPWSSVQRRTVQRRRFSSRNPQQHSGSESGTRAKKRTIHPVGCNWLPSVDVFRALRYETNTAAGPNCSILSLGMRHSPEILHSGFLSLRAWIYQSRHSELVHVEHPTYLLDKGSLG
jgi:hypothetical protein